MATPPTRPALRERYDRKRAQVVTDAARVFARDGYDQTTVQDLADELGIAAGGLYHYFGSKEQILIAICDQLLHPLIERARAVAETEEDAATALRGIVGMWVDHVVEHRDHMLVFQQERHVIEKGDQWRGVRSSRKAFERLVADLLARIGADGGLRSTDERLALSALLGMVNHTAQWYRPRGRLTPHQVADGYLALVLRD